MLKIFIGYDSRQPLSYNVLQHSIISKSSAPVSIAPLVIEQLPIKRTGLTPFTYSRFLVPYLCDYKGWALFLDADIILNDDVANLFNLVDENFSVMVSKNKIKFEWSSVILFNCEKCTVLTPEFIETSENLHNMKWAHEIEIGELPAKWNHLVGYDAKPEETPSLIHYTQGMPVYRQTETCDYSREWFIEQHKTMHIAPWKELMGDSVHAAEVNGVKVPRFLIDEESGLPAKGQEKKLMELIKMNEVAQ